MSSVDAWYSTTIDIEEVLSNSLQGEFHIFVADVVNSFEAMLLTVPWEDLDFRHGSAGSTCLSIGDGGILQGCLLTALFDPWCGHLKCNSYDVETLLASAQYTVSYVKVVGQQASPSKRVLLGTSKSALERMTAWRNENAGCFWAAKLDFRDSGGHLDVTERALAGTFIEVKQVTFHVIAVSAFPWVPTNAWNRVLQVFACWSSWL